MQGQVAWIDDLVFCLGVWAVVVQSFPLQLRLEVHGQARHQTQHKKIIWPAHLLLNMYPWLRLQGAMHCLRHARALFLSSNLVCVAAA